MSWRRSILKRMAITNYGNHQNGTTAPSTGRAVKKYLMQQNHNMNNHYVNNQKKILLSPFSTTTGSSSSSLSSLQYPKLKSWKNPVIECNGDYREQEHLEEYIGGPLYENQKKILKLPIPSLEETLERFLPTALPLARNEEESETLKAACAVFVQQSEELQKRLKERKNEFDRTNSSWLQLWWNKLAYLQYRDPVVVYVSYFFHLADDPTISSRTGNGNNANVRRGAAIVSAMAQYRQMVCSGEMPCEKIGKKGKAQTNLCSTAYKYMFHACRIPRPNEDTYNIYDPSLHKHIVVARKGRFFAMDFLDEQGQVLPISVLEQRLQKCIHEADSDKTPHYELGWLTTSNRDDWSNAREVLLRSGGKPMEDALDKLQSAAMMINFDDETPVSRQECGEIFWHGNKAHNRWFDKSIEIIITNNGKAGLLGEHSMMDGMPMVTFADHIAKNTYQIMKQQSEGRSRDHHVPTNDGEVADIFQHAFQQIASTSSASTDVLAVVEKAKKDYTKLISDHSLDVQSFHGFGSNFIKQAGFSPDAFVQIAMQLATYRLFGEQVGTYESTQVRPFLHGRTEVTRTVSTASSEFIRELGMTPNYQELSTNIASTTKKMDLLRNAVNSHVQYMKQAAQGNGVDRHFLGLSMCADQTVPAPELFAHPVFERSKRWRVSTSHLTHPKFDNWGYGEVVPDGVGLSYSIHPNHCIFNITALREHGWTGKLSHLIEEALLEMRTLVEMEKQQQPPRSKL